MLQARDLLRWVVDFLIECVTNFRSGCMLRHADARCSIRSPVANAAEAWSPSKSLSAGCERQIDPSGGAGQVLKSMQMRKPSRRGRGNNFGGNGSWNDTDRPRMCSSLALGATEQLRVLDDWIWKRWSLGSRGETARCRET